MPLLPSITPESEEQSANLLSEASSGYISTSLSAATLSDVYTLSWDLPPMNPGVDDIEAVTNECDQPSAYPGEAEAQDSLLVAEEVTSWKVDEATDLESSHTAPNSGLNHQDANTPSAFKVKEQELASDMPCQKEVKEHCLEQHPGSEQINSSKALDDSLLESLPKTEQTHVLQKDQFDSVNSQKKGQASDVTVDAVNDVTMATTQDVDSETAMSEEQLPDYDNPAFGEAQSLNTHQVLEPALDSLGPKVQGTAGSLRHNGTKTPPLSSTTSSSASTNADADASESKVPSSNPSTLAANPFKIQKVKSSDLHSFQSIIEKGEGESEQLDPDSSLGAGNKLAVPIESLEIVSDPEEGDAAGTVLPDWLKEGEFVTVGTNKCGTVRFVGPTDFAEGIWVGVELEAPAGRQTYS